MNKLEPPSSGIWAKLKKWWRDFFWVKEIFALEFGTSDVQSNYSRVYAWMANQLGHMTLGLAVALLFVWIVETSNSAIIKLSAWLGDKAARDLSCQWGWYCAPSNILLTLTFVAVLGGLAAFLLWWAWSGRCHTPVAQTQVNAYRRIPKPIAIACHAAVALALIGVVICALFYPPDDQSLADWAALMSTTIATLVIAAGIIVLCKDAEVLLLSVFGLGIVFVLGTEVLNAPLTGTPFRYETLVIAGLLAMVTALTIWLRYCDDDYRYMRLSGANWYRETAGGIFVIGFLWVLHCQLDADWRTALTAAFASVTLWWVKEFGSDIPGVHDEISRARDQRPKTEPGSEDDYVRVELDYLTDARMDARTDGLFYIAGAWIGAGVISDMPVLTNQSWETGAELVGCLIFIFIFMVEGRRWSFRQVALDRMGASRASRLAVFRSAIKMITIEPSVEINLGIEPPENKTYNPLPIATLDKFARGDQPDKATAIDHIFVFGAPGAGRTPLGLALASEAALVCHSTTNDGGAPRLSKRTGRFLRLNQLKYLLVDVIKKTQLQAYPPKPVWFHNETGLVRPKGCTDENQYSQEHAASLVIIDDVAFVEGETAVKACAALDLAAGTQQTVWMFETRENLEDAMMHSSSEHKAWCPDYIDHVKQIGPLRDAIIKAAGAPQRIAVVFVRRFREQADAV